MSIQTYNRPLHRLALLTTAATFPLIFMGGLVTSHGAGMSVPDWPNSYGYNMFLFPPRLWVGGILYEHTHRLMGTVVGMLSIALVVWAWHTQIVNGITRIGSWLSGGRVRARSTPPAYPRYVRWLAIVVLAAVILQGVLGGLRVVLVELDLAVVHACFAQAFFCLAALIAVVTSRWWMQTSRSTGFQPVLRQPLKQLDEESERRRYEGLGRRVAEFVLRRSGHRSNVAARRDHGLEARAMSSAPGRMLVRLAVVAVVAIYLQLIAGAMMRHYGAGLAIPDLPLAYGQALPPVSEAGLKAANKTRIYDLRLPGVTLTQVWLHFTHRVGAVIVTAAVVALIVAAVRGFRSQRAIFVPAVLLAVLLAAQVTLGVLTVTLRKPADIASAHVAVGALLLVTAFVLMVRSMRLYSAAFRAARPAFDVAGAATDPDVTAAPAHVAAA